MTPRELLEFADKLAADLLSIGQENGIPPKDLLMATTIALKLMQTVLYQGDHETLRLTLQEADATYKAATQIRVREAN